MTDLHLSKVKEAVEALKEMAKQYHIKNAVKAIREAGFKR